MEDSYERAFEFMVIYIGIDLSDLKQRSLLLRAIDYANASLYTPEPKSSEQHVNNEIFTIKTLCYFKRKLLPMESSKEKIKEIINYEWQTVAQLKRKLPMLQPITLTDFKNK